MRQNDWGFGFERDVLVWKDSQKHRGWCLDFDKEVYTHFVHMELNSSNSTERAPPGRTVLSTQAARGLEFEIWREALGEWEAFDPRDVWEAFPGMFILIRRRGIALEGLAEFEEVRSHLHRLAGRGGAVLRDPQRIDADMGGETVVEESPE